MFIILAIVIIGFSICYLIANPANPGHSADQVGFGTLEGGGDYVFDATTPKVHIVNDLQVDGSILGGSDSLTFTGTVDSWAIENTVAIALCRIAVLEDGNPANDPSDLTDVSLIVAASNYDTAGNPYPDLDEPTEKENGDYICPRVSPPGTYSCSSVISVDIPTPGFVDVASFDDSIPCDDPVGTSYDLWAGPLHAPGEIKYFACCTT